MNVKMAAPHFPVDSLGRFAVIVDNFYISHPSLGMLAIAKVRQLENNNWTTIIPRGEVHFSLNVKVPFMKVSDENKKLYFFVQNIIRKTVNERNNVIALIVNENGRAYGLEVHALYDGSQKLSDEEYANFIDNLLKVNKVNLESSMLKTTVIPDDSRYDLF